MFSKRKARQIEQLNTSAHKDLFYNTSVLFIHIYLTYKQEYYLYTCTKTFFIIVKLEIVPFLLKKE